jgi:PAS domain S-box-containing protein
MHTISEVSLRRALAADEFVPYFQPLVDLRSRHLQGFEVLARWKHPDDSFIAPDHFIPVAESTGMIGAISQTIFSQAFAAAAKLPDHLVLSLNISATQFQDRTLSRKIGLAAQQAGFPLNRIILEITESAFAEDLDQARAIVNDLKSMGARLALDDFGTGYSSLRHLQALPFDILKVDASFVRSMTSTRQSRKIVAAIIGLGQSLGMTTVAEGVEEQSQADRLIWLGCDLCQGWLFGRPVPAEELPAIVANDARLTHLPPLTGAAQEIEEQPYIEALPAQRFAHLQALYDGVPVGLCFLDHSLRFVSVNKRMVQLDGVSVAAHIGRRVVDVIPALFEQFEPYLFRALSGESLSGIEIRQPDAEDPKAFRTLLVSYQPARDEAEEVVGLCVAVVDITDRKHIEEALQESEDHYRHTVELSAQAFWTMAPTGGNLDIGPIWLQITGMTREECRGSGWLRAVHPDDLVYTLQRWQDTLATGLPIDIEFRIRDIDGDWRWMRSRGAPRRDSKGEVVRWYGSVEDISERKKMEQALRESEQRLQAVFNAVPAGIIIAELSGRIHSVNPRANQILRRNLTERLQSLKDYETLNVYEEDGTRIAPSDLPIFRALRGETVQSKPAFYQRGDTTVGWIGISAAPILDRGASVTGAVIAIEDIDSTKLELLRLQERIADLEKEVERHRVS